MAELEDRVNVLENEVKLLKNEIRTVLLDIREQVLVHYHPSLMGEEAPPSPLRGRSSRGEMLGASAAPPEEDSASRAEERVDQADVAQLARWAGEALRELGGKQVRDVVEVYDRAGYLSPKTKDFLLHFISLTKEGDSLKEADQKKVNEAFLELGKLTGHAAEAEALASFLEGGTWKSQ